MQDRDAGSDSRNIDAGLDQAQSEVFEKALWVRYAATIRRQPADDGALLRDDASRRIKRHMFSPSLRHRRALPMRRNSQAARRPVEAPHDSPLLFLATALATLAAPGPTNALFAMSGALHGVRRSLVLIPAGAAGYLIAVTLLGLALGPALAASPRRRASSGSSLGPICSSWRSGCGGKGRPRTAGRRRRSARARCS